jgi:5,10-methenyltetrahydrofolate synthetase
MDLTEWRRQQRLAQIAQRTALDKETLAQRQLAMDKHLGHWFPQLVRITPGMVIAIYWPHRNEYDVRPLAAHWREAGALIALPVVLEKAAPLAFRAWDEDTPMEKGPHGIAHPAKGSPLIPSVILAPAVGFDARGYRLGYGGGYFDRTLAALQQQGQRPLAIATAFEAARMDTLRPQPHDLPMDYVLTEAGLYRVNTDELLLLS